MIIILGMKRIGVLVLILVHKSVCMQLYLTFVFKQVLGTVLRLCAHHYSGYHVTKFEDLKDGSVLLMVRSHLIPTPFSEYHTGMNGSFTYKTYLGF